MTNENEVVDTGVDWITVTEVTGKRVDDLVMIAHDIKQQFIPNDVVPKPWGMQGYRGKSYGQLKIGTRDPEGAIMTISGDLAKQAYPAIPIPFNRVKRIDLQVTVRLAEADDRMALRHYEAQRNLRNESEDAKMWRVISSATGDTLYYGKRGNAVMLRFYDKSLDLNENRLGRCWRYEVEYRLKTAKNIAKSVAYAKDPYADIASLVWSQFNKVGFPPAYHNSNKIRVMEVGTSYVTPEGQVKWLERNVAPVVANLFALGYEEQVIGSLGLGGILRKGKVENATE